MHETVDLKRGPVARAMAKKIEEENKGWQHCSRRAFKSLLGMVLKGKMRTKTLLVSIVQGREPKEASLENLEGSNPKWRQVEDLPLAVGPTLPATVFFYPKKAMGSNPTNHIVLESHHSYLSIHT